MNSIREIVKPENSAVWLSFRKSDTALKLLSRRPVRRSRRKSITSTIKSNLKAALAAGLPIRAIRPDGEIIVGDIKNPEVNEWDEILLGVCDNEE